MHWGSVIAASIAALALAGCFALYVVLSAPVEQAPATNDNLVRLQCGPDENNVLKCVPAH